MLLYLFGEGLAGLASGETKIVVEQVTMILCLLIGAAIVLWALLQKEAPPAPVQSAPPERSTTRTVTRTSSTNVQEKVEIVDSFRDSDPQPHSPAPQIRLQRPDRGVSVAIPVYQPKPELPALPGIPEFPVEKPSTRKQTGNRSPGKPSSRRKSGTGSAGSGSKTGKPADAKMEHGRSQPAPTATIERHPQTRKRRSSPKSARKNGK